MRNHYDVKVASLLFLDVQNGILLISFAPGVECVVSFSITRIRGFLIRARENCDALFNATREILNSAQADICIQSLFIVSMKWALARLIERCKSALVASLFRYNRSSLMFQQLGLALVRISQSSRATWRDQYSSEVWNRNRLSPL